jgi:hypothetical protein
MSTQEHNLVKPVDGSRGILTDSQAAVLDARMLMHIPSSRTENHDPFCTICQASGELIACDNCTRSFHLVCINMTHSDIPYGPWHCSSCM